MGDQSDLLAEYEPPSPHLAKFARRLSEWTAAVAAAAGMNENNNTVT
jgi:hypothetical protein